MDDEKLSNSISILTQALCEYQEMKKHERGGHFKSHTQFATKEDLEKLGNKIMNNIETYALSQSLNDDALDASIIELSYDVQQLTNYIQISGSTVSGSLISAADQSLLDALTTRSINIVSNLDALATAATTYIATFSGSFTSPTGSVSGSNVSGSV